MRIVHRTLMLALLGLVVAGAAGALLVATAQSSPVFRVNWHFSVVNKHSSSRVGEFLATGEGIMDFNREVISGVPVPPDTSTGTVAIEYQQRKPRRATARIKFRVVPGGLFSESTTGEPPKVDAEHVLAKLQVTSTNVTGCRVGSSSLLSVLEYFRAKFNRVTIQPGLSAHRCSLRVDQTATMGPRSRIHAIIGGRCFASATAGLAPLANTLLCASAPNLISITDATATAGQYIAGPKVGQNTCAGGVTLNSFAQDCTDNQNVGTTLTLTARINGTLPKGDQLRLWYDAPNASDPTWQRCDPAITSNCVLAKTTSASSVTTTVTLPPDKSFGGGAHAAEAAVEIVNPQGYFQRGLGIQLCQDGTTPRCG